MIADSIKPILVSFDIANIIICLLLQFDFGFNAVRIKSFDKKIFNTLVLVTELLLITDGFSWIVLGSKEYLFISYIVLSSYFSLHLIICTIWIMYCDFLINEDEKHSIKVRNIFLVPAIFVTILAFASYKYPIIYRLTEDNVYYRGDYYPYFIGLCVIYLIYSIYIIIKAILYSRKASGADRKVLVLIVYPILPVAGVIIQTMFFTVNIIWMLTTISLIIVYFNFQNTLIMIDPLTKISNRYRFDMFLEKHFYDKPVNSKIKFLAIIDLDRFKTINDEYGHLEGDKVLKAVAEILVVKASQYDFVARLGGDEFVVFGERENENDVALLKEDINSEIDRYNEEQNKEYLLSLSMGFSFQNNSNNKSKKQMFAEADKSMYKEKRR